MLLQQLERWHVGKHPLFDLGESPIDDAPARKQRKQIKMTGSDRWEKQPRAISRMCPARRE